MVPLSHFIRRIAALEMVDRAIAQSIRRAMCIPSCLERRR